MNASPGFYSLKIGTKEASFAMASKKLLELRKQAEAVEARSGSVDAPKKTKKAAGTKTKRVKEKVQARKRLIWVVYNGSMKEEGRFPYDQREAAEERIELLRQKSKKLYFIQPLKEVIGEAPGTAKLVTAEIEEEDVKATKKIMSEEDDEDEDEEEEEEEDDDDDE
ncbi:MAG: hypothetical protein WCH39_00165 [Schlesneria sp.]